MTTTTLVRVSRRRPVNIMDALGRHRRLWVFTRLVQQQQQPRCCGYSSSSRSRSISSSRRSSSGEQLRIAIVGGGAAGLSAALHLAPLVEAGLVSSPIDVFTVAKPKRDIGVGIWSTALDPFLMNTPRPLFNTRRLSHQTVYQEMTSKGTWLGDVGYRTPSGAWLMTSHLSTSKQEQELTNMPALLFLRERDMLTALEKATHWEQQHGTLQIHQDRNKTRVIGLQEDSPYPWSTKLILNEQDPQLSYRDYHLIIAADGTHSRLRHTYGGHAAILASSNMAESGAAKFGGGGASDGAGGGGGGGGGSLSSPIDLPMSEAALSWGQMQQQEAVGLQDRKYTVFRGNSLLTTAEMNVLPNGRGISFQTWGEGRSMRFATVPMFYPVGLNNDQNNNKQERQVWFITIDDEDISAEPDPVRRRAMILEAFKDWHDPICRVVEATPPEEILMERAIAHRHCLSPVMSFNKVVQTIRGKRPPNSGEGPCLVFTGDASMTVDPILAQGFTIAMEGAYALSPSVKAACVSSPDDPTLAFDPYKLRQELKTKHDQRIDRYICLLRATELVQALGQPAGGTVAGFLNTKLLRPLTRLLPNFIKKPIFDATLKYSLGLLGPSSPSSSPSSSASSASAASASSSPKATQQ